MRRVSMKDRAHQSTGLCDDGIPSLVAAVIPSTVGLVYRLGV
jgi:hypothetical protein